MPRTVNFTSLGITNKRFVQIRDEHQVKGILGNKISWGEPAKICQAKIDRACPICGARAADIQYSGNQLIAGFESDGKDGMCGSCGYTFATGSDEIGPPAENPKTSNHAVARARAAFEKELSKAGRCKG